MTILTLMVTLVYRHTTLRMDISLMGKRNPLQVILGGRKDNRITKQTKTYGLQATYLIGTRHPLKAKVLGKNCLNCLEVNTKCGLNI